MGNNPSADELAQGSKRTILNHFFDKPDTMDAKTLLTGSVESKEDPIVFPPLYVKVDYTLISSI